MIGAHESSDCDCSPDKCGNILIKNATDSSVNIEDVRRCEPVFNTQKYVIGKLLITAAQIILLIIFHLVAVNKHTKPLKQEIRKLKELYEPIEKKSILN